MAHLVNEHRIFIFVNNPQKSRLYSCKLSLCQLAFKDGVLDPIEILTQVFADFRNPLQFHNGSIKRTSISLMTTRQPSFNSTMVRLKVDEKAAGCVAFISFNSTMVRLKARKKSRTRTGKHSFNSTMVRLKARKNQWRYYRKTALFLQAENYLYFQKSSTSGCAKFTGG